MSMEVEARESTTMSTEINAPSSCEDYYNTPEVPTDEQTKTKLKRKIMKNILLITLVFIFHFAAFHGLGNLQSSLHRTQGMGTINQSILYGAMILSALFIPKLIISVIGAKWTMPITMLGYTLWMAANGYAVWGTMVPTSILVGLCGAPLWTAQSSYISKIAHKYAQLSREVPSAVVAMFFGIYFGLFQISGLIGSVISSTVLRSPSQTNNNTLTSEEVKMYCGINDCPWTNATNPNLDKPGTKTLWTLVGIYIAIDILAVVIVCVFVDNLPKYMNEDFKKAKNQARQSVVKTVLHLTNKSQCLLIPITICYGMINSYSKAEWSRSFVSCSLGIWKVGFISIPATSVCGVLSFCAGYVSKQTGRAPIVTVGVSAILATQLAMIFWPLDKDQEWVFYVLSICWVAGDGLLFTQLQAMYGSIFRTNLEAAFANLRLWTSVGNVAAFAYSDFICADIKLYIIMSLLLLGIVCYYIVEIMEKRKEKKMETETKSIDLNENGQLEIGSGIHFKDGKANEAFHGEHYDRKTPQVAKTVSAELVLSSQEKDTEDKTVPGVGNFEYETKF